MHTSPFHNLNATWSAYVVSIEQSLGLPRNLSSVCTDDYAEVRAVAFVSNGALIFVSIRGVTSISSMADTSLVVEASVLEGWGHLCRLRRMWHIRLHHHLHGTLNCGMGILSNRLIISIYSPSNRSSRSYTSSSVGCAKLTDQPLPMRTGQGYSSRIEMQVLCVTLSLSSHNCSTFNSIMVQRSNILYVHMIFIGKKIRVS